MHRALPRTHMKKNLHLAIAVGLSAVLLLSGCGVKTSNSDASPSGEAVSTLPAVSQTEPVQTTAPPASSVSNDDNAIPKATADMFELSPLDTALFDGALTQDMPYSSGAGVTFPFVGIYDQYEDDGKLYVICSVTYVRYDADAATKSLKTAGTSMTYGRAIIDKNEDGTYTCDVFDIVGEGEGYGKKLDEFCGPLSGLADKILNGDVYPTSTFPDDLMAIYHQKTNVTIDALKEG